MNNDLMGLLNKVARMPDIPADVATEVYALCERACKSRLRAWPADVATEATQVAATLAVSMMYGSAATVSGPLCVTCKHGSCAVIRRTHAVTRTEVEMSEAVRLAVYRCVLASKRDRARNSERETVTYSGESTELEPRMSWENTGTARPDRVTMPSSDELFADALTLIRKSGRPDIAAGMTKWHDSTRAQRMGGDNPPLKDGYLKRAAILPLRCALPYARAQHAVQSGRAHAPSRWVGVPIVQWSPVQWPVPMDAVRGIEGPYCEGPRLIVTRSVPVAVRPVAGPRDIGAGDRSSTGQLVLDLFPRAPITADDEPNSGPYLPGRIAGARTETISTPAMASAVRGPATKLRGPRMGTPPLFSARGMAGRLAVTWLCEHRSCRTARTVVPRPAVKGGDQVANRPADSSGRASAVVTRPIGAELSADDMVTLSRVSVDPYDPSATDQGSDQWALLLAPIGAVKPTNSRRRKSGGALGTSAITGRLGSASRKQWADTSSK